MDKLARLQKCQEILKQATNFDVNKVLGHLAGIAGTAGVTMFGIPAVQRMSQNKKREQVWQNIIARNPDLGKEPEDREVFDAIFDTSPKAMSHPAFAVPIIRQAKDYGNYGIPPQTVQMLSRVNAEGSQSPDPRFPLTIGGAIGGGFTGSSIKNKRHADVRNLGEMI